MEPTVKIESPRFGALEIEPSKIVDFPRGLPGFESCRRYSLFHPEGEDPKYFILQSLDDAELAFYVADPARFGFNFEIALSDEEVAELGLGDPSAVVVLVMLTKSDESGLSANLKAPLIINLETRRGLQHVFAELRYDVAKTQATEQPK